MVFHWECVAQVDIFAPTALPTGSLVTHAQSFFSSVIPLWMGCWSIVGCSLSIKFVVDTHLNTWVERGTVRVKCLAKEHNKMSPTRVPHVLLDPKTNALTISHHISTPSSRFLYKNRNPTPGMNSWPHNNLVSNCCRSSHSCCGGVLGSNWWSRLCWSTIMLAVHTESSPVGVCGASALNCQRKFW